MAKVFRSLSDMPMEMSDADRALCIMTEVKYFHTTDIDGNQIVGGTALRIVAALKAEGFEIVRKPAAT